MNEENKTEDVKSAAEQTVKKGNNIREEIRDITMKALSEHQLDMERVKEVAKAVVDGAIDGLDVDGSGVKQALDEVTEGLDAALEKSAQATKLAIEETTAKVKDYSENDFKRTLDELSGLEDLLMDTLEQAAKAGKTLVSESLEDVIAHIKNTGSVVGRRTKEDVEDLKNQFQQASQAGVEAATSAAKSVTADIAQAASGFLAGLADSLKDSEDKPKS